LYSFCAAHRVPHDRCGKLVVAENDDEVPAIESLAKKARANGVEGLEIVGRQFIEAREPAVAAVAALWSPATGRVVLLGPTARFQDRKDDYESNRFAVESFLEPARAPLPRITLEDLVEGGSGIRPKLHPPSGSFADFMVRADIS
jgi:L-2-hydroxyglutarate oxidase LhgO